MCAFVGLEAGVLGKNRSGRLGNGIGRICFQSALTSGGFRKDRCTLVVSRDVILGRVLIKMMKEDVSESTKEIEEVKVNDEDLEMSTKNLPNWDPMRPKRVFNEREILDDVQKEMKMILQLKNQLHPDDFKRLFLDNPFIGDLM
mmetsp:Transcript_8532/g.15446  ORF Transcript_8532/g.15446 Transcript_8532/m.15446 type:complete len:144 (-) Transcript_8532:2-433(-)